MRLAKAPRSSIRSTSHPIVLRSGFRVSSSEFRDRLLSSVYRLPSTDALIPSLLPLSPYGHPTSVGSASHPVPECHLRATALRPSVPYSPTPLLPHSLIPLVPRSLGRGRGNEFLGHQPFAKTVRPARGGTRAQAEAAGSLLFSFFRGPMAGRRLVELVQGTLLLPEALAGFQVLDRRAEFGTHGVRAADNAGTRNQNRAAGIIVGERSVGE